MTCPCGSRFSYIGTKNIMSDNLLVQEVKVNVFQCPKCMRIYLVDSNKKRKKSSGNLDLMGLPKYVPTEEKLTPEEVAFRKKHELSDKELEKYMKDLKGESE